MKNLTFKLVPFIWILSNLSQVLAQNPGDVIINEIMYDSKSTDEEWVELFNITNYNIDISGWILTDDDTYPELSGEGKLIVPDETTIQAGAFVILCKAAISEIPGAIVCSSSGSFSLGNTGDNLALYTAAENGTLIDGILSSLTEDYYPDDAGSNTGESIEKIDPSQGWSGSTADWDASTNPFGGTEHVYCTPGAANSVWETTSPSDVSNFTASNPTANSISLSWNNPTDADFTGTLILRKMGSAPTGTPTNHTTYSIGNTVGDGIVVFIGDGEAFTDTGLNPNSTYYYKAFAYDEVRNYASGVLANETTIAVELASFTVSFQKGEVKLQWITQSETENLGFYIYRSQFEEQNYVKITSAMIPGVGNSNETHIYSYIDRDIKSDNTYFYKLADIDFNGNMTFHGPISITANDLPSEYSLSQNYPNPFNPRTTIRFSIIQAGLVSLKIYNLQGQLVRILINEEKTAGNHTLVWNGTDNKGNRLSSGIYYYTLNVNGFEETKKLILIK